jgi:hypothetical protein
MSLPASGISGSMTEISRVKANGFFDSLKAVVAASKLYSEWPGATISAEITKRPLGRSHWTSCLFNKTGEVEASINKQATYRSCKFACIAMLESGAQDLHPDQLNHVMAMACGNSIYVAEALLQDPAESDRSDLPDFIGIRRILGNLDRPGIVMLVPPQAPRIREPDLKSWKLVQQMAYDGDSKDSFQQTSLHLTFTEYEVPLAVAPGAVDAEITMLEALISVHDRRTWVADLDILGSLAHKSLLRLLECQHHNHEKGKKTETYGKVLVKALGSQLRSIENWEEFLCCKENLMDSEIGVVRTSSNWLSRLAAVTISGSRGYSTLLLPSESICASCGNSIVSSKLWKLKDGSHVDLIIA